jgi:uncharacterized membrane protein
VKEKHSRFTTAIMYVLAGLLAIPLYVLLFFLIIFATAYCLIESLLKKEVNSVDSFSMARDAVKENYERGSLSKKTPAKNEGTK